VIRARVAALALLALVGVCSIGADALGGERPVVILLSWDGTRHDYPERVDVPALARMQRDGARAERLTPVFPSSTFPNHVSLATGTYADRHGIIENSFRDASGKSFDYGNNASWIEAEPLWIAAERQGVRAAVFFWVGSESEWRGRAATYRVRPFDAKVPESAKVAQILAWLDLPPAERPGLIMSWWHGCDAVGHAKGPDSPDIARQLVAQDHELAALFAGIDARRAWAYTTVIVTADHGMSAANGIADVQSPLDAAGIDARIDFAGGEAQIYLADPAQRDAALAAYAGQPGLHAYASDAQPSGLRAYFPGRGGQITVIADPPRVVGRSGLRQKASAWWSWLRGAGTGGAHGYDPSLPDMGAIFFALGRGVPAGTKLGEVRAIDVAPTVAGLLEIDPPQSSEGRALFSLPLPQTASKTDAKP
jgi:arylsulfatase A-like enzyme